MKSKHLKFEEAAQAFLNTVEGFNVIPQQPSRQLSQLHGSTWHLRNARGPLGRVNRHGEVWIKVPENVN